MPWSKHGQRSRSNRGPYEFKEHNTMAFDNDYAFLYTDKLDPVYKQGSRERSEAVSALYYDADERELLVVIAESDTAYLYSKVPSYVWTAFVNSISKGYFYAKAIKNEYGPAKNLGDVDDLYIDKKSLGGPTVGTPKGLTYAADAKVTTSAEVFPLHVVDGGRDDDAVSRLHEVVFTVEGVGEERTYKTEADSVGAAVDALGEVAAMLSLNFTVKKVITHFE